MDGIIAEIDAEASTYLTFRGDQRAAAYHLLEQTPLGATIDRVNACDATLDLDGTLTVELTDEELVTFSRGERLLWAFLCSLGGRGQVNLAEVLAGVDRDCALACSWAMGLASGHFAAMAPVTFGGAL